MGLIGCYTIHLYCDDENHIHWKHGDLGEFTGETRAECIENARKKGWVVNYQGKPLDHGSFKTLCPLHSGKLRDYM